MERRGSSRILMLTKRVIPCLDIRDGRVVKGKRFENLVDVGDPVSLAARYSDEGAELGNSYANKARYSLPGHSRWAGRQRQTLREPGRCGGSCLACCSLL